VPLAGQRTLVSEAVCMASIRIPTEIDKELFSGKRYSEEYSYNIVNIDIMSLKT
jgi:hypothetical protein